MTKGQRPKVWFEKYHSCIIGIVFVPVGCNCKIIIGSLDMAVQCARSQGLTFWSNFPHALQLSERNSLSEAFYFNPVYVFSSARRRQQ